MAEGEKAGPPTRTHFQSLLASPHLRGKRGTWASGSELNSWSSAEAARTGEMGCKIAFRTHTRTFTNRNTEPESN